MKLPLKEGALALGSGVVAYIGGVQIQKASTWAAQHWYAVPAVVGGVGLVAASKKKSMPIGVALIGAAGAIGYFAYAAAKGQPTMQAQSGATPPATTTQTTSQVQPTSVPASMPAPATQQPGAPASTDQSGLGQTATNLFNQATSGGGDQTQQQPTDGSTGSSGYNAGALGGRFAPRMQRHAGAFQPNRHIPAMQRHAGHYQGGDAAGLET